MAGDLIFSADEHPAATAHWRHAGDRRVVPVVIDSVVAFGADRGMAVAAQRELAIALRKALFTAAVQGRDDLSIDAAADAEWLTVRIAETVLEFPMVAVR